MNIGIIKDGKCINAAVYGDIKTAQEHFALGVWPGASAVLELPDGYGIGDSYDGTAWTKAPAPEPEQPTTTEPTLGEQIKTLTDDNKLLTAQVKAATDRADFMEDVVAEMAATVYQ